MAATRLVKNVKPPDTSAVVAPCARIVATNSIAPGVSTVRRQTVSSAVTDRPRSMATRSRSAWEKSISPFMLRRVIAATASPAPATAASSSSVSPMTIVLSMSASSSARRRWAAGPAIVSTGASPRSQAIACASGGTGRGRSTASPGDSQTGAPVDNPRRNFSTRSRVSGATEGSATRVRTCMR